MILNPICPFTLSHRPLVIPTDEFIRIRIEPNQKAEVILTTDGQNVFPPGTRLRHGKSRRLPCQAHSDRQADFLYGIEGKTQLVGGSDA